MALNSWALTTVARFKAFIKKTDVADDTLLERIIDIATDIIERYCDRRFLETTYTDEYRDGTGWNQIMVKNYPINTREAFQLDERDTDTNEAQWSSVDTQLYHIDYDAGLIELVGHRFTEVPRKYKISYTAGYAFDNTTPGTTLEALGIGDLEFACWKIVNNIFNDASSAGGITSESIGNYSVSYGGYTYISPEIKMILDKYKRPHLM